jgi:hypothetical protein
VKNETFAVMMLEVGNHPHFTGNRGHILHLIHLLHNTDYLKMIIYLLTAEVVNILVMKGEREEKKS